MPVMVTLVRNTPHVDPRYVPAPAIRPTFIAAMDSELPPLSRRVYIQVGDTTTYHESPASMALVAPQQCQVCGAPSDLLYAADVPNGYMCASCAPQGPDHG